MIKHTVLPTPLPSLSIHTPRDFDNTGRWPQQQTTPPSPFQPPNKHTQSTMSCSNTPFLETAADRLRWDRAFMARVLRLGLRDS